MGERAGKVAIVTGASKGIGASLARAFAETVVNYTSNKADAGGWDASAGGFPAMTGDVPFLMKDVVLLAVSFYLLKQDVQSVVLSKVSRP